MLVVRRITQNNTKSQKFEKNIKHKKVSLMHLMHENIYVSALSSRDFVILRGALKLQELTMQEWTMQEWTMTEKVAGVDFAGVDNDGESCRGGLCRSGH